MHCNRRYAYLFLKRYYLLICNCSVQCIQLRVIKIHLVFPSKELNSKVSNPGTSRGLLNDIKQSAEYYLIISIKQFLFYLYLVYKFGSLI